MRQIGFAEISRVEKGRLVFHGGGSLDLADCAACWAQAHPEQYPDPAQCRCVGERWSSSHFILYSAEHIMLVNDVNPGRIQRLLDRLHIPLRLDTRRYDHFRRVQQMLQEAGWITYDMT